jgi:hypothetical protein
MKNNNLRVSYPEIGILSFWKRIVCIIVAIILYICHPLAMKRLLFAIVVAFCVTQSFTSSAQIVVGPKVGVNFNSFRKSKTFENYFDVIPGFNAGVFAKRNVLPYLTGRVEVLYMQQGANLYDYYIIDDVFRKHSKVRFHNIEVPVLVELGLPSLAMETLQPKLLLGGFYSYTFFARESYTSIAKLSGRPSVAFEGSSDVQNQFYRSQYGIIGALAADVQLFHHPVSLEFRYQYNMSRANKAGSQSSYNLEATTEKWGNRLYLHTLSFNVGVTLFNF